MSDDGRYEALISAGIAAYDAKDRAHFTLGQLAAAVEKDYGNDALGAYAADINAERARLAEYRTVWNFYEMSAVADYYDTFANLRYSHWRDAMRLGDKAAALSFLAEASDGGLKVEAARVELAKRLGKPVPGRKVAEFEIMYAQITHDHVSSTVGLEVNGDAAWLIPLLTAPDTRYRVVVYALPDAESASS